MGALSFAHPLLAAGLLGVAAPVIIHFLFRRRARNIEFPAMRFVLLSYKKVARKLLLHEFLLLATRCLMVALLALGLAVPLWAKVVAGISRGERPMAVVLVLDTSLSMTREKGGKTLLEFAQEEARKWLQGLSELDRAAVVDAVRLAGTGLEKDRSKLSRAIKHMEPAYARARMTEALSLASSYLSGVQELEPVIVVITDMQRSSWHRPVELSDPPPVYVSDIAGDMAPDNLSVGGIEIAWKALARQEAAQVKATVTNHGNRDVRQTLVRVYSGDEVMAQGFVDPPAGKAIEKEFVITKPAAGPGKITLDAADGMAADNIAFFQLKGGQQVRALVVDGEPGTSYRQSETYFLDRALDPRLYARSRVSPTSITASELDSADLTGFDVVILANAGRVDPKTAEKVKRFVRDGRGLLITLGGNADADEYNAVWGDLLPRELRGVKLSYAGAQGSSEIKVNHLSTPSPGEDMHPALTIFRDPAEGDLGLAGFWKYFLMQQQVAQRSEVLLRLTDGTPMMVEGTFGRGRVIMFASTADREWNDLCIHPTFLPLFQQVTQYLAEALVKKDEGQIFTGSVVEIPVGSDVRGARVFGPDGKEWEAELVSEPGMRRIKIGRTEKPGLYRIKYEKKGRGKMDSEIDRPDRTLVLNVDPRESDLQKIEPRGIKAAIGSKQVSIISEGSTGLSSAEADKVEKTPYAWALLSLLVALAVLERALTRKG